jgi:hypothetical protein
MLCDWTLIISPFPPRLGCTHTHVSSGLRGPFALDASAPPDDRFVLLLCAP